MVGSAHERTNRRLKSRVRPISRASPRPVQTANVPAHAGPGHGRERPRRDQTLPEPARDMVQRMLWLAAGLVRVSTRHHQPSPRQNEPMIRPAHGQYRPRSAQPMASHKHGGPTWGQNRTRTDQAMSSPDHGQTITWTAHCMTRPAHYLHSHWPGQHMVIPAYGQTSPWPARPVHGQPKICPAEPRTLPCSDHGQRSHWTVQSIVTPA
jgi:hypothetical protein